MERFRQSDLRNKSSVLVEGKTFDLVNQFHSSGQFLIIEKGPNGIFRGNVSVSSFRWLGKLLCQLSIEDNDAGVMFRTTEEQKTVTGTVRRNRGGFYLQVLIVSRQGRKNYQSLCFPAGSNKKGWSLMGSTLRMFVDPLPQQATQQFGSKDNPTVKERRANTTYAEVGNIASEKSLYGKGVSVNSRAGVLHASWWLSTVICSTNCSNPDWQWVEKSIRGVFVQANLRIVEEGGAVVFLNSPADVSKIINMPPLITWNGHFSFHKWTPEAGSFNVSNEEKEVELSFLGIPFHLRTPSVVSQLAEQCGRIISVDDGAITSDSQICKARVRSREMTSIPRTILLEERGYVFTVWIELNIRRLIGISEKKQPPPSVAGVVGSTLEVPRMVMRQQPAPNAALGGTSSEQSVAPGFADNRIVVRVDQVEDPSMENQWHRAALTQAQASPPSRPISNDEEGESYRNQKRKNVKGVNQIQQFKHLWRPRRFLRGRSRSKSRPRTILKRGTNPFIQAELQSPCQIISGDVDTSMSDLNGEGNREEDESTDLSHDLIQNKTMIAESLYNCRSKEDIANLIDWMIIPLGKKVGMTTSLSEVEQRRFFNEILQSKDKGPQRFQREEVNETVKGLEQNAEEVIGGDSSHKGLVVEHVD
ncbi:hypothetical protein FRX31_009022 [Thalictrum thalictroides]|uniref:DUF4283 domain-containing protein n=1 Tax=Thalictrum thalictroides TaxID=46969 RepID=A0A7J6WZ46_THATH|nr:hypothetical protein FRX31_009022 [Thalictrum thalictroides]